MNESQLLHFLIQFTLLFVSARALADILKRYGQPPVIGELLAGILLGPSVLGHFLPSVYALVFPTDAVVNHLIDGFAWLGVILLLLLTGLETDLSLLQRAGRGGVLISAAGIAVVGPAGFAVGWLLPDAYLTQAHGRLTFSLFIAVAMAVSAVPVIARVLMDLDMMRRDLGMTILAAGIIDDTAGWIVLSIVAGLATHGTVDLRTLGITVASIALFAGFCYYVGGALVLRLMRWVDDHALVDHAGMSVLTGVAMACAIVTQAIGIHAVFGAFLAGLMMGRSARLHRLDRSDLEAATLGVFAPVFFSYSGLRVDLFAIPQLWVVGAVMGVAIAGKFIGCGIGALAAGLSWREVFAVSVGMNTRGGMGIIVALIGLNLGVLGEAMYAIVIAVAIITSMLSPPLLGWILAGLKPHPEEVERIDREKLLSRLPFSKEGAKLLVLSGGGPHAHFAAHFAGVLAQHPHASVTIFRATTLDAGAPDEEVAKNLAALKLRAEASGASNVIERTASAATPAEAVIKESERGYDAIFAGAARIGGSDVLGGEVLQGLVMDSQAPLVIVRGEAKEPPPRRVLTPITGAPFSRLGAAVAMLYAHATGAAVTALYVNETSNLPFRGFYRRRLSPVQGAPIAEEIRKLGESLGIPVETRIDSAGRPENVILNYVERDRFDLLVMGVTHRPAEDRLYFGPKVDHILRHAKCAVAIVVFPGA